MTKPPSPFGIVLAALIQHAENCDWLSCRFAEMPDELPPQGDVRPGREAKRKRRPKRVA